MNKSDPLSVVERKFSAPHWVFLREFRNGTGFSATRSADALAVGLYQSRGQWLLGFEQKISRPDWLRELRNPDKADPVVVYCDFWNIVVPNRAIVQLEELPETWGLILVENNKLKTIKAAPRMKCRPMSRNVMASIIKRASDAAVKPYLLSDQEKEKQANSEGFEQGKLSAARELERLHTLEKQWKEFEDASGIRITEFNDVRNIGDAVNAIVHKKKTVRNTLVQLGYAVNEIRRTLAALDKHKTVLENLGMDGEKTDGAADAADAAQTASETEPSSTSADEAIF